MRWGLDAYLDLLHGGILNRSLYYDVLRPDILRLRNLTTDLSFRDPKFWGPAIDRSERVVAGGWKMKRHNFGIGGVQLRLCVALVDEDAYLCHAYVKTSGPQDKRMAGSLKDKIGLIRSGSHDERGELP